MSLFIPDKLRKGENMNWLVKQLRKETWSPYVAGILLGMVGILAVCCSSNCWVLRGHLKTWPE